MAATHKKLLGNKKKIDEQHEALFSEWHLRFRLDVFFFGFYFHKHFQKTKRMSLCENMLLFKNSEFIIKIYVAF